MMLYKFIRKRMSMSIELFLHFINIYATCKLFVLANAVLVSYEVEKSARSPSFHFWMFNQIKKKFRHYVSVVQTCCYTEVYPKEIKAHPYKSKTSQEQKKVIWPARIVLRRFCTRKKIRPGLP